MALKVAACVIWNQQFFGQTVNKFSKRWTAQRGAWNKPDNSETNDQKRTLKRNG